MELQERALCASVSISGDEGALTSVAAPHRSLDVPRDIPRRDNRCSNLPIRPGTGRARWPRLRRRPKLRLLNLVEEQGERAVEDRARVAVRDLATEKSLNAPQLVVALLADRELDAIALRRGGLDDGTSCRNDGRWSERWRCGGTTTAASTRVAGEVGADTGVGAGTRVALGSLRTEDGTSGRGANSAARASISRRLRPQALARTAAWFSGVRCRRSSRTEVSDIAPETRWSRITGKLRHARAASIRLQAASSESRSTSVQ
jgi:hypothetical protein